MLLLLLLPLHCRRMSSSARLQQQHLTTSGTETEIHSQCLEPPPKTRPSTPPCSHKYTPLSPFCNLPPSTIQSRVFCLCRSVSAGEVERLLKEYRENQELVRRIGKHHYQIIYPVQLRHHEKMGISTREVSAAKVRNRLRKRNTFDTVCSSL